MYPGGCYFEKLIFWKLCSSFVLFHFSKKGKLRSILNDFNIWDNCVRNHIFERVLFRERGKIDARLIFWKLCLSNSFVLFHFSKKGKLRSILNDFNIWDNCVRNYVFERVLFRKRKDDRYMVDILETLFIEFVRSLSFLQKRKVWIDFE